MHKNLWINSINLINKTSMNIQNVNDNWKSAYTKIDFNRMETCTQLLMRLRWLSYQQMVWDGNTICPSPSTNIPPSSVLYITICNYISSWIFQTKNGVAAYCSYWYMLKKQIRTKIYHNYKNFIHKCCFVSSLKLTKWVRTKTSYINDIITH